MTKSRLLGVLAAVTAACLSVAWAGPLGPVLPADVARVVSLGAGPGSRPGAAGATSGTVEANSVQPAGRVRAEEAWVAIDPVPGMRGRLFVAPADARVLYMRADADARVYRSSDRGARWQELPIDTSVGRLLAIHPGDADRLLLSGGGPHNGVLLEATEGGRRLTPLNAEPFRLSFMGKDATATVTGVQIQPGWPDRLFASAQVAAGPRARHDAVFRSDDAGATWRLWYDDGTLAWADPARSRRFYALADIFRAQVQPFATSRLMRTDDDGAAWQPIDPDPDTAQLALAIDTFDPDTLYAARGADPSLTRVELCRSRDGGANWTRLTDGLVRVGAAPSGLWSLAVDPVWPGGVAAAPGAGGVYLSDDYGETWRDLSGNLGAPPVAQLTFDPAGDILYVVLQQGGLYGRLVR